MRKMEKLKKYTNQKIKKSEVTYNANTLICTFENAQKNKISVEFQVSNYNIALRYQIAPTEKE